MDAFIWRKLNGLGIAAESLAKKGIAPCIDVNGNAARGKKKGVFFSKLAAESPAPLCRKLRKAKGSDKG
jgi:hypothetical protein